MTFYGPIECCSLCIFKYFNIYELKYYYQSIYNKEIQKSISYLIKEFKKNTYIYKFIFYNKLPYILKSPIIFLELFKTSLYLYLFNIFKKINYDSFFLVNKDYKVFFVKKINNETILFFHQIYENSIYVTKICKQKTTFSKIDFYSNYIYKNDAYTEYMNIIKDYL